MISKDEEVAYDISHNTIHRWWQPSAVMLAFIIVVIVMTLNLAYLHQQTALNTKNALVAKATAELAAKDAYHNCVITRALEQWSKELGRTQPTLVSKYQTEQRDAIYSKLHEQLLLVDGQVCLEPPGYSVKAEPHITNTNTRTHQKKESK